MRTVLAIAAGLVCFPAHAQTQLPEIPTNTSTAGLIETCGVGQCLGTELSGGEAKLRFFCRSSHLAYDDPIVNPGHPGAAHLHHFFGNDLTRANSTYETLRTLGGSTCQGGILNRSGYWFPAMIDGRTNKVIKPRFIELYYRNNPNQLWLGESTPGQYTSPVCPDSTPPLVACPTFGNRTIPRGLRLITGWNFATGAIDPGVSMYWSCQNPTTGSVIIGSSFDRQTFYDPANPSDALNDCVNSGTGPGGAGVGDAAIVLVVSTNGCWNGDSDHADHRSHVKGNMNDGLGTLVCPNTHPYVIPNMSLIIAWDFDTDSSDFGNWYLSSDRYNGATHPSGKTFHTDFFWAWDQPTMDNKIGKWIWGLDGEEWRSCAIGCLGDGTRLIDNGFTVSYVPAASRYLDMPKRGGAKGKIRARIR